MYNVKNENVNCINYREKNKKVVVLFYVYSLYLTKSISNK